MASKYETKTDRKYTKEHEWALTEGDEVVVGISAFAVDQLGDVTLVNIDVKPGQTIEEHQAFGTIESVKTLSDLFAPVSGTVTRVNTELENRPELVNEDCWGKGWMIAIKPSDPERLSALLDADAYQKHVESSGQ
ncbi:MAG: glycine cleavage system protein GcvH [Pseudomonadota bacterium]|nr:MAG: glycine cleavage system protein GcvH [Pseudomonadota bacterium]